MGQLAKPDLLQLLSLAREDYKLQEEASHRLLQRIQFLMGVLILLGSVTLGLTNPKRLHPAMIPIEWLFWITWTFVWFFILLTGSYIWSSLRGRQVAMPRTVADYVAWMHESCTSHQRSGQSVRESEELAYLATLSAMVTAYADSASHNRLQNFEREAGVNSAMKMMYIAALVNVVLILLHLVLVFQEQTR